MNSTDLQPINLYTTPLKQYPALIRGLMLAILQGDFRDGHYTVPKGFKAQVEIDGVSYTLTLSKNSDSAGAA